MVDDSEEDDGDDLEDSGVVPNGKHSSKEFIFGVFDLSSLLFIFLVN